MQALSSSYGVAIELVELSNLALVGERILMAALQRRESRGAHYRADFPGKIGSVPSEVLRAAPARSRSRERDRSRSLVPAATPPERAGSGLSGVKRSKR